MLVWFYKRRPFNRFIIFPKIRGREGDQGGKLNQSGLMRKTFAGMILIHVYARDAAK